MTLEKSPILDQVLSLNTQKPVVFFLFFVMGMGANWVAASAMFQEVPYLEVILPEGLCISASINAAVNTSILFVFAYIKLGGQDFIPNTYMIPCILMSGSVACFFAALLFRVKVLGISLFLFFGALLGGITGAMTSVVITPWLMRYRRNLISATRGGGSFAVLLCGVVAHFQHPDQTPPVFSAETYLCIFGCLLVLPLFAYRAIMQLNVGLIEEIEVRDED